ncbi:cysteine-rich protein 2-binding protein [Harpegnathos saltator]|uniref:Cysteine-rich protein 2-binding protein n=1 Tax=Harpegnathos saltator TaxID=610380 RepID=E2BPS0_HARSA|nr:cysteine-rich protein 2-binding protein [Harpegnathos saltator]XP_011142880.1 cysteine-rich protein 2-binding protein [Harpegnathos saltator]EFN82271.1 Cysteine-rich protein 2-binding protein [Harpegnathos saltator]
MSEVEKENKIADSRKSKETANIDNCKICEKICNPYDKPGLHCSGGCNRKIHIECLKRGNVPTPFVGDVFFDLTCTSCNPLGEETVVRNRMPWLNVIVLTLYNLREKSSGISNRGYFHWKSDISTFVDKNWDTLFKKSVKKRKNWTGTISGTLSHYGGIFFKSGTVELDEAGWWKLLDNDPPEILIARNNKVIQDRKKNSSTKIFCKSSSSSVQSDSSISVGEDSNCGGELFKHQNSSVYSHAYVQPTELLSDFLFEDDEPNDLNTEDNIMLRNENCIPSISDLIRDCQYEDASFQLTQSTDNCDWLCNTNPPSPNDTGNESKTIQEEEYDEDSNDSPVSIQEQPPASLFKETQHRKWPWSKRFSVIDTKIPHMTRQEEAYLLQKINKADLDKAPPHIRRLYRKLAVRKTKREYGLPLLDVDCFGSKSGVSTKPSKSNDRVLDRFFVNDLGCIFEQRLQGYSEPTTVHSPYTNRLLKPFIRRDAYSQPLWLRIMEEVCAKANKNNPEWKPSSRAPIDYSYIKPQHIPAINSLCSQFFWPGIDLTECLQYPDFTCVVLYKKLVIGFAVLVPEVGYNEAYISFILTRPEWRKAGIGTFMLYHLIQTCMGRDVTLHVSATNPALILYQKFSFKVEEFIQDFYDKYMPPSSRECRHALFLRLNR